MDAGVLSPSSKTELKDTESSDKPSVFIPLSKAAPDLSLFDKSSDMTPLKGAPIVGKWKILVIILLEWI